jgi:hypothetical protein
LYVYTWVCVHLCVCPRGVSRICLRLSWECVFLLSLCLCGLSGCLICVCPCAVCLYARYFGLSVLTSVCLSICVFRTSVCLSASLVLCWSVHVDLKIFLYVCLADVCISFPVYSLSNCRTSIANFELIAWAELQLRTRILGKKQLHRSKMEELGLRQKYCSYPPLIKGTASPD